MTKFALTNHDWERFGLTHKTLPRYELNPIMATARKTARKTTAKRTPTPAQLAARERFAEMARSGAFKRKTATKRKKNPLVTEIMRSEIDVDPVDEFVLKHIKKGMSAKEIIQLRRDARDMIVGGAEIPEGGLSGESERYITDREFLKWVESLGHSTNPASKAAGVKYRNEAKDTKKDDPAWIGYAVHRPSSPNAAFAILKTKDEAVGYAQELADRKKTPFAVTRIRYKVAQG